MSTLKTDDLEAVRTVAEALKDFKPDEQQRIFRWVAEKLGLPQPFAPSVHTQLPVHQPSLIAAATTGVQDRSSSSAGTMDIKSFMSAKRPRSDVQFAAAVAYYYRFNAPEAERKDAINKDDLEEAARKATRDRFANPLKTLQNAHQLGLLDKGSEKATFTINSVGENLVAMTLPGDSTNNVKPRKAAKRAGKKTPPKLPAKKSAKRA